MCVCVFVCVCACVRVCVCVCIYHIIQLGVIGICINHHGLENHRTTQKTCTMLWLRIWNTYKYKSNSTLKNNSTHVHVCRLRGEFIVQSHFII